MMALFDSGEVRHEFRGIGSGTDYRQLVATAPHAAAIN